MIITVDSKANIFAGCSALVLDEGGWGWPMRHGAHGLSRAGALCRTGPDLQLAAAGNVYQLLKHNENRDQSTATVQRSQRLADHHAGAARGVNRVLRVTHGLGRCQQVSTPGPPPGVREMLIVLGVGRIVNGRLPENSTTTPTGVVAPVTEAYGRIVAESIVQDSYARILARTAARHTHALPLLGPRRRQMLAEGRPLARPIIASRHMSAIARLLRAVAAFVVALAVGSDWVWGAQPAITMSVGPDEALNYPSNLPSLPDEHTTIFPPAPGSSAYRFFASSSLTGGNSGAVVLETTDLQNFTFASGYSPQVMSVPVRFTSCNPAYDSEFDENYAGPGSVVQDPTRPPGNLIMIYEAENHCPGGVWQQPFYATVGFARSADNGKTWPPPPNAEFGDADRYPVLKLAAPEPATEPSPAAMGNAIPSAIVDGNYLYVAYVAPLGPGLTSDGKIRIARAQLGGNGQAVFSKWNNGAFSAPGIGGIDSGFLPSGGCVGSQAMPSIYYFDPLQIFLLTFVCRSVPQAQAAWYFSTATSLDLQDWTVPQLIRNSQFALIDPCPGQTDSNGMSFDGWYPSLMSPGAASGHIAQSGYAYLLNGCDTGKRSFARRTFSIGIGPSAPNVDQQGLTGSWYQVATSGQGVEIEVFPDMVAPGIGFLQGGWFTFDDAASGGADHGRWYTFGGKVRAGESAAVLPIYQNVGGNFNALPVTSSVQVGNVGMSFSDCASAQLSYTFTDGSGRIGTVPLTRLTPNVICAQTASTGASGDFGLSGNWFDPTKSGQGFVIELNQLAKVLFFAWYTYAVNGQALGAAGQRWYTGQANYVPGGRSIPLSLYETTGGLFNSVAPVPTTAQVGTGKLTFTSCNAATLSFAFIGGSNAGQAGSIALARVGPAPASCTF